MVALVYSVIAPETIDSLRYWIKEVMDKNNRKCVILLIGNKIDISSDHDDNSVNKTVERLCEEFKIDHLYTSAKEDVNVDEIFRRLVARAEESHVIENSSIGCHRRSLVAMQESSGGGCWC